jgi:hypothetical protein
MNAILIKTLFTTLTVCFYVASAHACSCRELATACEAFGAAEAVFVGKAVASQQIGEAVGFRSTRYTIEVGETFLGNVGPTVIAETFESACPSSFVIGKEYLIYAGASEYLQGKLERFAATFCSRTMPLDRAKADLRFLRKDLKKGAGSRIYGWVRNDDTLNERLPISKRTEPIAGVLVRITGAGRIFDVFTDAWGYYSLDGLSGGGYFVKVFPPPGYGEVGDPEEIHVNQQGCSKVNYYLYNP